MEIRSLRIEISIIDDHTAIFTTYTDIVKDGDITIASILGFSDNPPYRSTKCNGSITTVFERHEIVKNKQTKKEEHYFHFKDGTVHAYQKNGNNFELMYFQMLRKDICGLENNET